MRFSFSNNFSFSSLFTSTFRFTTSDEFTSSCPFLKILTKTNDFSVSSLNILDSEKVSSLERKSFITFSLSMTISFIKIRSVSFSFSYYSSNFYFECNDDGIQSICFTNSFYFTLLPYIIQFLSPTFVPVHIQYEIANNKKGVSSEQLIGIVCGSVAVFFCILGIILLLIRKKKYNEFSYEYELSSDNLNQVEVETQTNFSIAKTLTNDIDDWL